MTSPYGTIVLEHFRRPRNQRSIERPTAAHEGYNPLCGDRVRIEVAIDDDVIRDAAFTANACAICTASASLLTERLTGSAIRAVADLPDAELIAALGADIPPARETCATLPLHTFREAIARFRAGT